MPEFSVRSPRGRACSGCPAQHPANPSASPSTAVLHGDSACVGRSSTRCHAGSSARPRCGNPRVKRLNSALWWPTPHCSRRSRSIPERFPIDSASLARQTQFGVHIRPKTVEIRGDSAVSGRVRSCCRALKLPTMPSLSIHTKHGVVRRRDDGVLDMMVPHLQRENGGH